ncbi:hypothetical protein [Marinagarivorans algicola]|uniref:hypothetical protein n=1 Tax=Marinagarivorans algicola TaxID=1513270 RepID=UPI0037364A54
MEEIANNSPNTIYSDLVSSEDDILGIIAYSVYKRQKISHLESSKVGATSLQELASTPEQQDFYRQQAIGLLDNFAKLYLEEDMQDRDIVFQDKISELETSYTNKLREFKPSFWSGVWQSVVGAFVFVLCMGVLVFTLWAWKQGIVSAVEVAFDVTITKNPEPVLK